MNRTIRNLIIAAPLATIGLTLVPVGAANAGPNGPVIIIQPNGGDPEPNPPKGPQDKAPLPPKPKGPQDKAPLPKPKGPQDKAPKPAAKAHHTAPNAHATTTKVADVAVAEVVSAKGSPDSIDRADVPFVAGLAETKLVADASDDSMDLTWLLVGGGVITASGIAFAARKRSKA